MSRRYYANNAPRQTLAAQITSGATSCSVAGSFAGWPVQFPFFAALDLGTASFEIVSVTAIVGTTATIVRGQDGSSAITHPAGATLDQVAVQKDFDEANAHVNGTTGVHGLSGAPVGTSDSQTLTNKTLSSPALTGTMTGAGAINTTGAITTTQPVTGSTVAAAGNVTGVIVQKTFTNEAAATAAIPSPTATTVVWLTAPTGGWLPGLFYWTGSIWSPITPTSERLQATQTTAGQSLGSSVFTGITAYAAPDVDTFGGSSFNATTGIWTCPAANAGQHELSGQVSATGATAVRLIAAIFKNGSALYSAYESGSPSTQATSVLTPKEFTLAAGDTISLQGNPNAAGVVTTIQNGNGTFLRIKRVG